MSEEPLLFEIQESYNLVGLRDACMDYVKKKYPQPMEDEDYDEYLQMLNDEADLEFCDRMRKMADQIEERVLNPIKKKVQETYRGIFK